MEGDNHYCMIDLSDRSAIERRIVGALRTAIAAHGPIDHNYISSAAKRVYGELKAARREQAGANMSWDDPLTHPDDDAALL